MPDPTPHWAWCLTGSGHFLRESLELAFALPRVDFFLSKAAAEVLVMYGYKLDELKRRHHIYYDGSASAPAVAQLYRGMYHTLIIAPATSNTVAKCALGLSDTLPTNVFAQAGKCQIPSIVFACDSEPVEYTEAPGQWLYVYPRAIDLAHTDALGKFDLVRVVRTANELKDALRLRQDELDKQKK